MKLDRKIVEIGRIIPRIDAFNKVRGLEKYASDYHSKDMIWVGVKRAGIPHARLKKIKIDKAKHLKGVIDVLTHKDVKGTNRQGVVRKDQPVLVDDKIRYAGDAVALVLAKDKKVLMHALSLIAIDYEPLPPIFDAEKAINDKKNLVHEDNPDGNVLLHGKIESGKGNKAFSECDLVVEASFEVPYQEHAYLETEAGWAILDSDGMLTITVSTQTPFRDRSEVAEALGLDIKKVRIIAPYCGGAFGGKDGITVQTLLGLAALTVPGKPVKIWLNREESFISSVKRHQARLYYKLGAKKDGKLHALDVRFFYDTGPYDHLGGVVMALGLEHSGGPYHIPNTNLKGWVVYTNNPIGGAFRAFGVSQVTFAMEQMVDMVAKRLNLSPLEIRLRNVIKKGDKIPIGTTMLSSTGITDCLNILKQHPLWKERERWKRDAPIFKKRGVGIASIMHAMGYGPVVPDYANAKIELTEDGKFRIFCGVVDMGQGNINTYMQIAANILNQDIDNIELILPDTEKTLPSGSSSASRTTYTFGNALIDASKTLKEYILNRVADLIMAKSIDEFTMVPGKIIHLPTGKSFLLKEITKFLNDSERIVTKHYRAPVSKELVSIDERLRLHGIPHLIFSFASHLAYVEIDELTGEVEVKKYLSITDSGKIINPQILEQQIHGAIAQGLGYAIYEDFVVEDGKAKTLDFSTYIIPTAMDLPDIESINVELHESSGPFGMKGAGEINTNGPLPAVANGVADALDIRIFRSPLTGERILMALKEKKEMSN